MFFENGITKITEASFMNCNNLMTVYFPSTINFINNDAFKGCDLNHYRSIGYPTSITTFLKNHFSLYSLGLAKYSYNASGRYNYLCMYVCYLIMK